MTTRSGLFENSDQQIAAELGWLELIIKREIAKIRRSRAQHEKFDEFSGLYVSEADVDAYLAEAGGDQDHAVLDPDILQIENDVHEARDELDCAASASLNAGIDLRLSRLASAFDLEAGEMTILLACLAPDVDLRFQKYYAYLQNDVSKRRPTVQLLHRLVAGRAAPPLGARTIFGPTGKLPANNLVLFPSHRSEDCFPLLQPIVPITVADYLAGIDGVDAALAGAAVLSNGEPLSNSAAYFSRHRRLLEQWMADDNVLASRTVVLLGPDGSGRADLISAFAAMVEKRVLTIDGSKLAPRSDDLVAQLRPLSRDARMHQAVIHVRNVGELRGDEGGQKLRASLVGEALAGGHIDHLFLTSRERVPDVEERLQQPIRCDRLHLPSIEERTELWQDSLPKALLDREPELPADLATRFAFTPAKVRATALRAGPVGGHNGNTLSGAAYFRACRMESNQNLLRFGRKIDPSYEWHDVVLPPDTRSQLHEICACVRHKRRVVEGWGFGAKFSVGKGLVVLFAGASGTGKTMCAEIIGGDLELDVYKIDLSCVVSKYIGETERNLSRIFDEAETSNSILFFDEADALFGKRTEVKDAHDRYANIEINYLLQKLDDYEGIVILATNLRGNLDQAFTRRLNYLVDFPFPDEHDRERIWTRVFPNETPLREDIRLDFLARKFKLAGGNIKNIAVNSAYLAADNGGRVGMEQLILATKREYQKLGRLCSKSEFGPYFNLVQEQQP
jgi:hypothetical protein